MTPEPSYDSPAARLAASKNGGIAARPEIPVLICRLRAIRATLRLSMNDVAQAAQIKHQSLSIIESGGNVKLTTALRLSAFFGMPITAIWSLAENSVTDDSSIRQQSVPS